MQLLPSSQETAGRWLQALLARATVSYKSHHWHGFNGFTAWWLWSWPAARAEKLSDNFICSKDWQWKRDTSRQVTLYAYYWDKIAINLEASNWFQRIAIKDWCTIFCIGMLLVASIDCERMSITWSNMTHLLSYTCTRCSQNQIQFSYCNCFHYSTDKPGCSWKVWPCTGRFDTCLHVCMDYHHHMLRCPD